LWKRPAGKQRYDLLPTDVAFHSFMGLASVGYLMIESPFSAVKSISDSLCRGCSGSYLTGTPAIRIIAGFRSIVTGLITQSQAQESFNPGQNLCCQRIVPNVNRGFFTG
jgi:hypothetical protein